jgi:UDP-N-acetylmuramoyl-tripeptide--D-alanyl-D-alanine ligase
MLLTKDFLLNAMPYAKFYVNGDELTRDTDWNFYNVGKDVIVAFDSRLITSESVFFALNGQNLDGHDFLPQALDAGACVLVVSKNLKSCLNKVTKNIVNRLVIFVPDTYAALVDMAKAWRATFNFPVVGITGSIGKTSTKEILRSILQQTGIPFYISAKNQNTFIGLCANILNVSSSCKVAAFEVGVSEPGEMAVKADILRPTIALITKISHSHISQFGDLRNVAYEKRQIFRNFKDKEIGIIFGDQSILADVHYVHPVARYGFKTRNHVQARKIKNTTDLRGSFVTEFSLKWYGEKANIKFGSTHQGLLCNALAASTIAYFIEVPLGAVIAGLESYSGFDNRFEQKQLKNNLGVVISDCYNANPESMKVAISAFDKMNNNGKKIVVIGDMLELGNREIYWHRNLGKILNKASSINSIILVGNLVKYTQGMLMSDFSVIRVNDWQEAEEALSEQLKTPHSLVLVKASHGIALDKLVAKVVA